MLETIPTGDRIRDRLLAFVHIDGSAALDAGPRPGSAYPLTKREHQVLSLVAEGWPNKLIGAYLAITERTVKSHLTNIMGKLQASDRTHAVVTAVRLGWLAI